MRTIAIVLVLAVAVTALAGTAAAHEDDAKVELDSDDYYYCVGGWGTYVHTHVGPASVGVAVCHPPMYGDPLTMER